MGFEEARSWQVLQNIAFSGVSTVDRNMRNTHRTSKGTSTTRKKGVRATTKRVVVKTRRGQLFTFSHDASVNLASIPNTRKQGLWRPSGTPQFPPRFFSIALILSILGTMQKAQAIPAIKCNGLYLRPILSYYPNTSFSR